MKTKCALLSIVFCITIATQAFAQSAFEEGINDINLGIGFGNLYYGGLPGVAGYNFSASPAITLSVDHGFKKVDAIEGTIGLGGLIGFQSASSKYSDLNGYYYKQKWNNFIISARGTYHADFLNTDKFDLYGGIMLGLRIESYTFTSNYALYTTAYQGNYGGANVTEGIFVGGTYYFTSNIGVFGELGYDVSYLKVGLSFKAGGK